MGYMPRSVWNDPTDTKEYRKKQELRNAISNTENLRFNNSVSKYMSRTLEKLLLEIRNELQKELDELENKEK